MAGTKCDLFEVRENEGYGEGLWLEQRLLHVLGVLGSTFSGEREGDARDTYHCHQSKVALLFQIGFDELETSTCGLANRLDEEALADSELDARVIWT